MIMLEIRNDLGLILEIIPKNLAVSANIAINTTRLPRKTAGKTEQTPTPRKQANFVSQTKKWISNVNLINSPIL